MSIFKYTYKCERCGEIVYTNQRINGEQKHWLHLNKDFKNCEGTLTRVYQPPAIIIKGKR